MPQPRRLVLFAHFDPFGRVDDHVLVLLKALSSYVSSIHFVSGCSLPPAELDRVSPWCQKRLIRPGPGYDFRSWAWALTACQLMEWDEVLFVNDSVYGPVRPLGPVFARLEASTEPVWGLTTSRFMEEHIQSYFMVFRRRALEHPAVQSFWPSVGTEMDRETVIRRYEVGLSRVLAEAGLAWGSFLPASRGGVLGWLERIIGMEMRTKVRHPIRTLRGWGKQVGDGRAWKIRRSGAYEGWREAVEHEGLPFVKVRLVSAGDHGCHDRALQAMLKGSGYDPELIRRHQERLREGTGCISPDGRFIGSP